MAENSYLTSPVAYDILALIYQEDEPYLWNELMDALDVNKSTLSKQTKAMSKAGILDISENERGNNTYDLDLEMLYRWWKQKIEQEVIDDIEYLRDKDNEKDSKMASKLEKALSSFSDENYLPFFRRWTDLYLSHMINNKELISNEEYTYKLPGDFSIHKIWFKDLLYALNWEETPDDFEYNSTLTRQQVDNLRDLLGPLAGDEFRKLKREWYKPDY